MAVDDVANIPQEDEHNNAPSQECTHQLDLEPPTESVTIFWAWWKNPVRTETTTPLENHPHCIEPQDFFGVYNCRRCWAADDAQKQGKKNP